MKKLTKFWIWFLLSFGYIGFIVDVLNTPIYKPNAAMWTLGIGAYIIGTIDLMKQKNDE